MGGGVSEAVEKSKTIPHLRNVNMDSMLSGTIRFLLDAEGVKTIGTDPKSNIVLGGIKYVQFIQQVFNYFKSVNLSFKTF